MENLSSRFNVLLRVPRLGVAPVPDRSRHAWNGIAEGPRRGGFSCPGRAACGAEQQAGSQHCRVSFDTSSALLGVLSFLSWVRRGRRSAPLGPLTVAGDEVPRRQQGYGGHRGRGMGDRGGEGVTPMLPPFADPDPLGCWSGGAGRDPDATVCRSGEAAMVVATRTVMCRCIPRPSESAAWLWAVGWVARWLYRSLGNPAAHRSRLHPHARTARRTMSW